MSQLAQRLLNCEAAARSRATLAERETIYIQVSDYQSEYQNYQQAEGIVLGLALALGISLGMWALTAILFAAF